MLPVATVKRTTHCSPNAEELQGTAKRARRCSPNVEEPQGTKRVRFNHQVLVQAILPLSSMVEKDRLYYHEQDYDEFKRTFLLSLKEIELARQQLVVRCEPKLKRNAPPAAWAKASPPYKVSMHPLRQVVETQLTSHMHDIIVVPVIK